MVFPPEHYSTCAPDEAPELTDEFFEKAVWRIGDRVVIREEASIEDKKRRGPLAAGATKVSTTIRFDADVLTAFKAQGDGWQLMHRQRSNVRD